MAIETIGLDDGKLTSQLLFWASHPCVGRGAGEERVALLKGVVFVELLKMAEDLLGEQIVDDVIAAANLPSGGAYTSVGLYPCAELMALVAGFSKASGQTEAEMQRQFGHWMMAAFERHYPDFVAGHGTGFGMLESIEDEVHVEVLKIYPDAELPSFSTQRLNERQLTMTYQSSRPLALFCKGLIEACMTKFGEDATVEMQKATIGTTTVAEFTITRA